MNNPSPPSAWLYAPAQSPNRRMNPPQPNSCTPRTWEVTNIVPSSEKNMMVRCKPPLFSAEEVTCSIHSECDCTTTPGQKSIAAYGWPPLIYPTSQNLGSLHASHISLGEGHPCHEDHDNRCSWSQTWCLPPLGSSGLGEGGGGLYL